MRRLLCSRQTSNPLDHKNATSFRVQRLRNNDCDSRRYGESAGISSPINATLLSCQQRARHRGTLIKSVLMDENDDSVVSILGRCRSVLSRSSRVIVIEHLFTPPNEPDVNCSDMTMMVMTGGREQTQQEFESLFAAAGLRLEQAIGTRSPFIADRVNRLNRRWLM